MTRPMHLLSVIEVGDDIESLRDDCSVFVCNHQSTFDVPAIMAMLAHKSAADKACWIMDNMFKLTQFGAVSFVHGDFFIKQVTGQRSYIRQGRKIGLYVEHWSHVVAECYLHTL